MQTTEAAQHTIHGILSDSSHILISAPTGGGKSYAVGYLVERLYAERKPFIIFDTSRQNHIGLWALKDITLAQIRPGGTEETYQKLTNIPYLILIPGEEITIDQLISEYRKIINAVYYAKKPRILIIEECHYYSKNASAPDQSLDRISREGRKYGIFGWFITQRCQDIPKIFWSSCRYYLILKYWLHTDISYLSNQINNYPQINADMKLHDLLLYNSQLDQVTVIPAECIKRVTKHYG